MIIFEQRIQAKWPTLRNDDRPLQHVSQLADVTRPGIILQLLDLLLSQFTTALRVKPARATEKVFNQQRNVLKTLAQRCNLYRKGVQAIVEVLTKGSGSDLLP